MTQADTVPCRCWRMSIISWWRPRKPNVWVISWIDLSTALLRPSISKPMWIFPIPTQYSIFLNWRVNYWLLVCFSCWTSCGIKRKKIAPRRKRSSLMRSGSLLVPEVILWPPNSVWRYSRSSGDTVVLLLLQHRTSTTFSVWMGASTVKASSIMLRQKSFSI